MMNKGFKALINSWKYYFIAVLGIVIVAVFLRSFNLTVLPIFGDEAIYIRWSQVMGAEPSLRFLPLSDGKQPLFMWVLMFLVRRFNDPLLIGRLTSGLYGVGTLIGIFSLSYYLLRSKKVAIIASLFWAISPYAVFYDRLALVDSMLAMFGVWTLFFAVVTVKTLRTDFAMLTGFSLGAALITKSPALYFVLMLPLTWSVSVWPKARKRKVVGKKHLIHLIRLVLLSSISVFIAFIIYNILRLGVNFHLINSRNFDYVYPISQLWLSPLSPFISNIKAIYNWIWILGPGLIIVFLIFSLIYDTKKRIKAEHGLIFLWTIFPIIVSAVYAKAMTARYILFVLPTFYIFTALVFDRFEKVKIIRSVLIFGLVLYVIVSLQIDINILTNPTKAALPRIVRSGYLEEWTSGTGIREVSELLRQEYVNEPDKKIVVGTEGYFGTLPDGLQVYLNDLREITVIGVGIDLKEIPQSLIESKMAGNKTYLVINSSRLKVDPAEIGLGLIAAYPKALRKEGTREYNTLGPRETLYFFEVLEQI